MSVGYNFNSKIDNFLEVKDIENFVFTSIQDEEREGDIQSVCVLQFVNRLGGDVTQEDLLRLFHLRKLIGAATVKCQFIAMAI